MNKKKILLIFGANGNLGKIISKKLIKKYKIITAGRVKNCKILFKNYLSIPKIISNVSPDIIINLIAKTDVDDCEKNKRAARLANIEVVKKIVIGIKNFNKKIKFIHFSTDHIYSNKKIKPSKEIEPEITNYYAKTKFLGEKAALKCNSIIIRTNFIGKQSLKKKLSLSDWIYHSLKNNKKIFGYKNIFFNPLHTSTLVEILVKVIEKKNIKGIFNLGANGYISKYDLIKFFSKKANKQNLLTAIDYKNNITRPRRPFNMIMHNDKIENFLSIKLPSIQTEINKTLKEYF